MIYKEYKGEHLSALGMGAMRLPTLDGDDARIDETLRDGLRHVAESDESEFDFHNASPRFPDGQPQVASCLLHQYTRQI